MGRSIITSDNIQNRIYTIRGLQVMLDRDLAELYQVETKVLNQAVKRNIDRFPVDFRFQLSEEEFLNLKPQIVTSNENSVRSQSVTLKNMRGKHRKYLPYVFTEQGVAMLASVLRSETAVKISINIIKAFIAMRKFILTNAQIFQRLEALEIKQLKTDKTLNYVLNAIESKEITPKQGIFFEGQIFDAYKFVSKLIRSAKKSILLFDNYIDETVLTLLTKKKKNTTVIIYTKKISKQLALDLKKYNKQYPTIEIREFDKTHDRFLVIDNKELYHFGASLKDLGKKWCAFSKMDVGAVDILKNIKELI